MSDLSGPETGLSRQASVHKSHSESCINHTVFTRAHFAVAWKIFSDCNLWPGFLESHGSSVHWHGAPWNAGSRLYFDVVEPKPARIECLLTLCTPPQCVGWIIRESGHTVQQCVLFEPYVGGGTKITTWIELADKEFPDSFARVRSLLTSLLQTWFSNFTAECDHQARLAVSHRLADSRAIGE